MTVRICTCAMVLPPSAFMSRRYSRQPLRSAYISSPEQASSQKQWSDRIYPLEGTSAHAKCLACLSCRCLVNGLRMH